MPEFAKETAVSPEKSRAEIEAVLRRYKADSFFYGWDKANAMIAFRAFGRNIRFVLPMPDRAAREYTHVVRRGHWEKRTDKQADDAYQQAVRQRWRALLLTIKAKLEAVECKISTFENEFMAFIILPDGRTVGEWAAPQVEAAYQTGQMPGLLPYRPAGQEPPKEAT